MALTLLIIAAIAITANAAEDQITINCTVDASPVPEGSAATIKCKFPFDLKEKKKGFRVFRKDDEIVSCPWNTNLMKHNCTVDGVGYQVQEITSEVRIWIPRTTSRHSGDYSCHLLNSNTTTANKCVLVVTEIPFKTRCIAESVAEGKEAEVICVFNKNLNQVKTQFLVTKQPLGAYGFENESLVFDCIWKGHELQCSYQMRGYTVDTTAIDSTVKLKIESASKENEGRYICRAQSSLEPNEEPCVFKLLDTDTDAGQEECSKGESTRDLRTLIIVILVILIILLIVVLAFIIIYKKCRNTNYIPAPQADAF